MRAYYTNIFTVVAHSVWALPIRSLNPTVLSNRDASPIFSCEHVECDKCRTQAARRPEWVLQRSDELAL